MAIQNIKGGRVYLVSITLSDEASTASSLLVEAGRLLAVRIRTDIFCQACTIITHPCFLAALRAPCSKHSEFASLGSDLS